MFLLLDRPDLFHQDVAMTTYGFIGLGSMGTPMAVHLARYSAAHDGRLLVWNRSPGNDGPIVATDPAALVAASDVVVVMLPDLPELRELTDGPAGLLAGVRRPTVLAVCSSVSPQAVRAFADHA